jgi:hypothetical protein
MIIIRVDRGEATQPTSQAVHTGATVALQTITVQTTTLSRSVEVEGPKIFITRSDIESQPESSSSQKELWNAY